MKSVVDCKYLFMMVWSMVGSGMNLRPSLSISVWSVVNCLLDMLWTSLFVMSLLCILIVSLCFCSCVGLVVVGCLGLWLLVVQIVGIGCVTECHCPLVLVFVGAVRL